MPNKKSIQFFFFVILAIAGVGSPAKYTFADLDDDIHKPIAKPSSTPLIAPPSLRNEKADDVSPKTNSADKKRAGKGDQKKNTESKTKFGDSNEERKQPIKWNAKGMQGDRKTREVDLLEEVVITQGNLKLESNKAKVIFSEDDEVEKVVASGNVRVTKDAEDETQKMSARGREAIFDNSQRTVTMIGDARLFRGADLVRGKQIVYNLNSGMIKVEGVEGVVQQNNTKSSEKNSGEKTTPKQGK